MVADSPDLTFDSNSHRAVDSYRRALRAPAPDADEPARQLHAFFAALYDLMFEQPGLFGMSAGADIPCDGSSHCKDIWDDAARALKQPLKRIETTTDLLRGFATHGKLVDDTLVLPASVYREMTPPKKRLIAQCVAGLREAGVEIEERDDSVIVTAPSFPKMLPALAQLAREAATAESERLAHPHFAHCRIGATPGEYSVEELFACLDEGVRTKVSSLDAMLRDMGCSVKTVRCNAGHWDVNYHPARKVKSTQLVRVSYDSRYRMGCAAEITPAATNRLAAVWSEAPDRVQADFLAHSMKCNHDSCGWCDTRKGLEPSALEYGGETRQVCWWMRRHLDDLSPESMELVADYVAWHRALG